MGLFAANGNVGANQLESPVHSAEIWVLGTLVPAHKCILRSIRK